MPQKHASNSFSERESKRVKVNHTALFDDPSNMFRVSSFGKDRFSNDHYIQGKIVALWPVKPSGGQIRLECADGGGTMRKIDILLRGTCTKELSDIEFSLDIFDEVAISLRDASLESRTGNMSSPHPTIVFERGIVLMCSKSVKRANHSPSVIDTWTGGAVVANEKPEMTSSPNPIRARDRTTTKSLVSNRVSSEQEESNFYGRDDAMIVDVGLSDNRNNTAVARLDEGRATAPRAPLKNEARKTSNVSPAEDSPTEKSKRQMKKEKNLLRAAEKNQENKSIHTASSEQPENMSKRQAKKEAKRRKKLMKEEAAKNQADGQAKRNSSKLSMESSENPERNEKQSKKEVEDSQLSKSARIVPKPDISKHDSFAPATADSNSRVVRDKPSITSTIKANGSRRSIVTAPSPAPVPTATRENPESSVGLRNDRTTAFTTELPTSYSAISGLHDSDADVKNIIGIVFEACTPKVTNRGDHTVSIRVFDSSCFSSGSDYHLSKPRYRVVNAFNKASHARLPSLKETDIVILKGLKAPKDGQVDCSVGYHDRFQWSIYDPSNIDKVKGIVGPDGLKYCEKLHEWWQSVQAARNEYSKGVHQVGDVGRTSAFTGYGGDNRQYFSVQDVTTDIKPKGYFNCVVEMLRWDQSQTIYVTDYTSNNQMSPSPHECSALFAGKVLPITLWQDAQIAPTKMKNGHYYQIQNVKAHYGRAGYLEAKMFEPKVKEVYEDGVDNNDLLRKLLQRKKALKRELS